MAKLQIERQSAAAQLAELHGRMGRMQKSLTQIQEAKEKLESRNSFLRRQQHDLLASVAAANRQRMEANKHLAAAQKSLKHVDTLYLKAARRIFAETLHMRMMMILLATEGPDLTFSSTKSESKLVHEISTALPSASSFVQQAMETFLLTQEKSDGGLWKSNTFQEVIKEFRKHLSERQANIVIATPGARLWADAYVSQLANVKKDQPKCVQRYWEGLAQHEQWTSPELKSLRANKDFATRQEDVFKRYCSIMGQYMVTRSFNRAWFKYAEEVSERLMSIPKDIMKNVRMKPFPVKLLQPPKFQGTWMPKAEDLQFED